MTDREIMQLALDCLENAVDLQQAEIDDHIAAYGEWYRPQRVKFMKEYLNKTNQSIEAIRARLAEPPKDLELPLVRPEEFVKLIQGKENFWGIPVMRTEWPTPEPKAQFEFQNYGWWRDEEGKLQLGTQPQGE